MSTAPSALGSRVPFVAAAALVSLGLAVGAAALSPRFVDPSALLGAITGAARPAVAVGAVANGAGVGGDAVLNAARRGLDDALANVPRAPLPGAAARGARVLGGRNGHVFDATVVRVVRAPGRVLAEASVVVSSLPGRAYQFASSSTITLTGATADTDEGLNDAVRRAMRSAATRAVDQMSAP